MKEELWRQSGRSGMTCGAAICKDGVIIPRNIMRTDPVRPEEAGVKLLILTGGRDLSEPQRNAAARVICAARDEGLRAIGVRPGLPAETLVRITLKTDDTSCLPLRRVGVVLADTERALQVIALGIGNNNTHDLNFCWFDTPQKIEVIKGYSGVRGLLLYWAEQGVPKHLPISMVGVDDAFCMAFINARRAKLPAYDCRGGTWRHRDHVQAAERISSKELAAQIAADSGYALEVRIACVDATEDHEILKNLLEAAEQEYGATQSSIYRSFCLEAGWMVVERMFELNKELIASSAWVKVIVERRQLVERDRMSTNLREIMRLLKALEQ